MPTLTLPEGTNITRAFDTQMLVQSSLGGQKLFVRSETWPRSQLLTIEMINVTNTERGVIDTFFQTNQGIEITLERPRNVGSFEQNCSDDNEQLFSWTGIVLKDPVYTQRNWNKSCSLYNITFTFQSKV